MRASRYIAALAPATVLAGRPTIPNPTEAITPKLVEGFAPKITGAARIEDAAIELMRRYVDYDQTCGFVDANLASALTCSGTNICATNTIWGVAGCCNPLSLDSCYLFTSCVPSSKIASCTASSCLNNEAVAKCTDSAAPYCVDWEYDYITTTLKAYGCDVSDFTGTVQLTYSGQDIFDISSYLTSIPEFSFPTVFVTQTQVLSAGLAGSTSSSSSSSSRNNDNDGSSRTPIAAIVGGVIGGLAALTIVSAVVIFLLFKKRRDRRNAAAVAAFTPAHPQQQQQQQGPPPPPPMPYGAPTSASQYKPPPMQQTGNTASFYAPPPPPPTSGDVKHEYVQHNVASMPSTPGPYSPPLSPSPQYTPSPVQGEQHQQHQQRWDSNVPQIDGTPVHRNSEGQQIYEAP